MTTKQKIDLLNLILKQLSHNHSLGESLFTCHMVDDLYGAKSEKACWYKNEIKNFYDNHTDFSNELVKNLDFYDSIKNKIHLTKDYFWIGVPFSIYDYTNRVKLLKYLIKYYSSDEKVKDNKRKCT